MHKFLKLSAILIITLLGTQTALAWSNCPSGNGAYPAGHCCNANSDCLSNICSSMGLCMAPPSNNSNNESTNNQKSFN